MPPKYNKPPEFKPLKVSLKNVCKLRAYIWDFTVSHEIFGKYGHMSYFPCTLRYIHSDTPATRTFIGTPVALSR